jgi:ribonuclease VapC
VSAVVVDSSALAAIALREPSRAWLIEHLWLASDRLIAAPNVLELGMVLESRLDDAEGLAARSIRDADVRVRPFTAELAERGINAWRRYGKGRHPAKLNFGDCCTYALAEHLSAPILCTGDDFAQTDLPVLRPPEG